MVNLSLNYSLVKKFIVHFIREEVRSNKFEKVVIGLSGGLDSALVAFLSVEALGNENVINILLPYKLSAPESLEHAMLIKDILKTPYEIVDISDIADEYIERTPDMDRIRVGNLLSRIRMSILFDKARANDALVMGTSNKSEIMLGYTTWYGDMASGLYPIGDLYKTQIFELSKFMELPEPIISKAPSADLWPGQTDEGELGDTYISLDSILSLYIDERKTPEEIIKMGFDETLVQNVIRRVITTQFKRTLPPVAKFSMRTLGMDFLYPHDLNK